MSGLSVIIPSKSARNLAACIGAVRRHEPTLRIIVVDDGVDFETIYPGDEISLREYLAGYKNIEILAGKKPFVFGANCNIGIEAAGKDDVVLLNDDAQLESDGGFQDMQIAVTVINQDVGLVSATTNLAGNVEQYRRPMTATSPMLRRAGQTPGNSFPTVAFVCVLIPRATINKIGLLDERFTAYGWEDNDYCRRVHNAGLKIGIADFCYVDHAKLKSTFRGEAYAAGDINAGRMIYLEKWGSM